MTHATGPADPVQPPHLGTATTYSLAPASLSPGDGQPYAAPVDPWSGQPVYRPMPPRGITKFVLELNHRSPSWAAPAAILLCFAGAASYVLWSNPTDGGAADIPTCIVKLTTGLDCPGCGGTRAFYYLLHGNVGEAVRYHAVAVFAAPFLVWLYAAWAIRRVTGKQLPTPTISARTLSIFLAAWAAFMVVRNIPISPFTSLYV